MFRASSRAPTGAGASSVTRVAAIAGNRSSVGRLRLNRPARATETGAEKGSPLKVPVTMDQQLEAQLEAGILGVSVPGRIRDAARVARDPTQRP